VESTGLQTWNFRVRIPDRQWDKAVSVRRLWWAGPALASIVALGLWLRPYALAVYHLEAGGQALETALAPVFPDRLAPEQVVDNARLKDGTSHLHAAVRWDPRNVQALRLLARVYLSQGRPEAALEVLQQALAIRPADPLLRLELGDVYDSLGQAEAAVQAYEAGGVGSRSLPLAVNYLKLAEAQMLWGSGDYAIRLWRTALTYDPDNLHALYRLAEVHRDLGDEEHADAYEAELQHLEPCSVTVPLDVRMAQFQGEAMVALVDADIWERSKLLDIVSYQVERSADGTRGLMAERLLRTMLEQWPGDQDLLFHLDELYRRRDRDL